MFIDSKKKGESRGRASRKDCSASRRGTKELQLVGVGSAAAPRDAFQNRSSRWLKTPRELLQQPVANLRGMSKLTI